MPQKSWHRAEKLKGCRRSPTKARNKTNTLLGTALKRWQKEKWKDVRTGKPCGSSVKTEYCRPTKKVCAAARPMPTRRSALAQVSAKTPKMRPGKSKVRANYARKAAGMRAKKV